MDAASPDRAEIIIKTQTQRKHTTLKSGNHTNKVDTQQCGWMEITSSNPGASNSFFLYVFNCLHRVAHKGICDILSAKPHVKSTGIKINQKAISPRSNMQLYLEEKKKEMRAGASSNIPSHTFCAASRAVEV